jgi:hypothetical protein
VLLIERISGGLEVVPTLLGIVKVTDIADGAPEGVEGASGSSSQMGFEL